MKNLKLSFNKKSAGDIASSIFIIASGIVMLGTAFGLKVPGDVNASINAWVSVLTLIAGSGGLLRNTTPEETAPKKEDDKSEIQK